MKLFKDSYWLKSGMFSLLERLSFMLFGFGSVFFLLRQLSKEDFGIWALFLTVTAFVEVARNGLVQNALIKNLASAEKSEHGNVTTASLVLNILLTVLSIVLLISLAHVLSISWKAPDLEMMLYIYVFTTAILIPFSQCNFVQQANMDFRGNFWSNFVRQGSLFIYIVVLYFTKAELTLIGLAIFQVYAAVGGALISYLFARKYLVWSTTINWKWVKELFHFGKYVFGTNLGTMLYKSIDKIMLGSLIGTVAVAIYDIAIRITNLIEVPTASMAAIVFPQSAKKSATEGKKAVKYLYERSVGVILALIVPGLIFVFIFSEEIILLIAGEDYLETVPLLRLTLLYGMFIPFSRQFGTVLDSIGMPKINFYFVVLSALLNVIFNYIFIINYGVVGAIYGTLCTFFIRLVLNQIVLHRLLRINFFNSFIYAKAFYLDIIEYAMKLIKLRQTGKSIL